MAKQIKVPSTDWSLDYPEIRKRKRMEEHTETAGEEEYFYLSKDQFYEWGNEMLHRLEIREWTIERRMDADLKRLTSQIEDVYRMKIQREGSEKEKNEIEANVLKYQSKGKCEVRGNKHDEGTRGTKLEPSPSPTTVLGAATSSSATIRWGGEIERLNRFERQFVKHDGEIEGLKREMSEILALIKRP